MQNQTKPTIRKRKEDSGPVLAVYRCWSCQAEWQARFEARWQLLDPHFKRDTCPSCGAGAGVLCGYTPALELDGQPAQLELEL